jgi:hypothetical protein
MHNFLLLPVALAMVLAVRLWPSWRFPAIGSDDGTHLLLRREIRRNRFQVPSKLEPYLFVQRLTYPWLFHQLIAFLPEPWLRRLPALPSAIIDGGHTVLAYLGGVWLATTLGHPEIAERAGFWSGLFFGVNPALLAHGMGPRAYEVTPRPLGEFFFSAAMMAAIWAVSGGGWGWWLVSVLAGGALLLSSKFAAQVLVIFVPLLSMMPGFFPVLLVVPASFVAAMVVSRGRYMDIFRGQVAHLRYFRRKLQYMFSIVTGRNRWRDFSRIRLAIQSHGLLSRETLQAAGYVYMTNTYLLALSRSGLYFILLFLCLSASRRDALGIGTVPALWLLAWAFVWIIPFVLISTKHFRFLGEAERYAEYGILPAAVLVGFGVAGTPITLTLAVVLLLYGLNAIGVVGHAWIINARVVRDDYQDREELVGVLQGLPPGSVLLGIPAMQVLAPVAFRLPHRYADIIGDDGVTFVRVVETQFEGYPWPKPDWAMWRALGVEYVVTFSPEYLRTHRPSLRYDQIPLDLIFSNSSYRVYAYQDHPDSIHQEN